MWDALPEVAAVVSAIAAVCSLFYARSAVDTVVRVRFHLTKQMDDVAEE